MKPEERVTSYYRACTSGDATDVAAHFCDDATVYDVNHGPVSGSAAIGDFWVQVREAWGGAAWAVDSILVGQDRAAVEWTMTGRRRGVDARVRGAELFEFREGLIAEIRQYWRLDREQPVVELVGYPYGERPSRGGHRLPIEGGGG